MNKERFMKDFNGEKIFSLEYDKETLKDMVIEKQEEIEDLKKQVELLVKDDESSQQTIINQRQEIEKLNNKVEELMTLYTTEREVKDYYKNIINELEKWLEERVEKLDIIGYDDDVFNGIELALQKLKELKGSGKID